MDRLVLGIIARFVVLVGIQVLILNNINLSGIINPYLYVYFLIVLPVDFRPSLGLVLGFVLGLTIDIFCQTYGMHTIATTFAGFCRPYMLTYMAPRDGYEFSRIPGVRQMGWLWFITYSSIILFLHHFVLFFIEMFRMSGFWFTIFKTLGSTVLSILLVIIVQLVFVRSTNASSQYD